VIFDAIINDLSPDIMPDGPMQASAAKPGHQRATPNSASITRQSTLPPV